MERHEIDQRFRIIQTIWAALAAGVGIFAAMVWLLNSGILGDTDPGPALFTPGLVVGLLAAALGLVFAGMIFRRGRTPRPGDDAAATLTAYQTHIVVSSAIQEGGGLLGLSVCFLSGQGTWALGVGMVTVFAMVLTRPRREELDRLLR